MTDQVFGNDARWQCSVLQVLLPRGRCISASKIGDILTKEIKEKKKGGKV
jgi:hypothetical protein